MNPFHIPAESIKIRSGETALIDVNMLGFYPGIHLCQVVLSEYLREVTYEVSVTLDLPQISSKVVLETSAEDGKGLEKVLSVPSSNSLMIKAIGFLMERLPTANRAKMRPALTNLLKPKVPSFKPLANFKIEFDSPLWQAAPTIPLYFEPEDNEKVTPKVRDVSFSLNDREYFYQFKWKYCHR